MEEPKNLIVAVRIGCPLCGKSFKDRSKKIYNLATEKIYLYLDKACPICGGKINQEYWTEKGVDGEIRLCIGRQRIAGAPVTTLSGMLTTNGRFDPRKLKIFKNQGLNMKIFDGEPKEIVDQINNV